MPCFVFITRMNSFQNGRITQITNLLFVASFASVVLERDAERVILFPKY